MEQASPTVQIGGAGIFRPDYREKVASATDLADFADRCLQRRTHEIPLRAGLIFGMVYSIPGEPGRTVSVRRVNVYPAPGRIDAVTKERKTRTEHTFDVELGKPAYSASSLVEGVNLLPGNWAIELWVNDRLIGAQAFHVVAGLPDRAAAPAAAPAPVPAPVPAGPLRLRLPPEFAGLAEGRSDKDFDDLERWVTQATALGLDQQGRHETLVGSGWPEDFVGWYLGQRTVAPTVPPRHAPAAAPAPTSVAGRTIFRRIPVGIYNLSILYGILAVGIPVLTIWGAGWGATLLLWMLGVFVFFSGSCRSLLLAGRFGVAVSYTLYALLLVAVGFVACGACLFIGIAVATPLSQALKNAQTYFESPEVRRFFGSSGLCPGGFRHKVKWHGFLWTSFTCPECGCTVRPVRPGSKAAFTGG